MPRRRTQAVPEIRQPVGAAPGGEAASAPRTPEEDPKRTAKGQFPPKTSGNPGGRPKQAKEVRAAFLKEVPWALQLVKKWRKSSKHHEQRAAVDIILNRAIGKAVKASELPDTESGVAASPSGSVDASSLLAQVRSSLAEGVAQFQRRQQAGDLGLEDLVLLGQLGSTLSTLAKEERQQREEGEERNLAEVAMLVRWLEQLPATERTAFFERIQKGPGAAAPQKAETT